MYLSDLPQEHLSDLKQVMIAAEAAALEVLRADNPDSTTQILDHLVLGSWARGMAQEWSDIDLCLLMSLTPQAIEFSVGDKRKRILHAVNLCAKTLTAPHVAHMTCKPAQALYSLSYTRPLAVSLKTGAVFADLKEVQDAYSNR